MPDLFRFQVTEEYEDERIDKYMASLIDSLSRSFIQKMMKEQKVLVNNIPVKANYRLRAEDEICFTLPEAAEPDIEAENIPLDILYEDDDVLVVNKPKGMVVHPAAGHYSGTLVNAVMYHCRGSLSGINGVMRPGIVHRIDRDTTGSLIICKNDNAHLSIAAQLKDHTIVRRYRAIVHGVIREEELCINSPVEGIRQTGKRWRPGSGTERKQSPILRCWSVFGPIPILNAVWKPAEPTRSEYIWTPSGIRCLVIRFTETGNIRCLMFCRGRHSMP